MLDTCLILNAPPGVGKDTLANLMTEYGFHKHQMKDELYIQTSTYFGVDHYEFVRHATDRKLKEQPWSQLKHPILRKILSPREALIYVSEHEIKPRHGKDFFGKKAAEACLRANSQLAVFSDGGFKEEVAELEKVYFNVIVVHLHRDGFTWGKDSRSYIHGFPNTFEITLLDDKPEQAITQLLGIVDVVKEAA